MCFERGLEHADDAAKKKDGSHIHNHLLETHSGEEIAEKPFKMKVIQQHRSALSRQIQEAVLIANSQGVELLNSKTEYNRCIIPRLAVMVGIKERDTGKEKWIEENEMQEMEESTGRRKREANIPGLPKAKRRKRWKREAKVSEGKREAQHQPEERYSKRRRLHSKEATSETNEKPAVKKTKFRTILDAFKAQERSQSEKQCQYRAEATQNNFDAPSPESQNPQKTSKPSNSNPNVKPTPAHSTKKVIIPSKGEKKIKIKKKEEKVKDMVDIRAYFEAKNCQSPINPRGGGEASRKVIVEDSSFKKHRTSLQTETSGGIKAKLIENKIHGAGATCSTTKSDARTGLTHKEITSSQPGED